MVNYDVYLIVKNKVQWNLNQNWVGIGWEFLTKANTASVDCARHQSVRIDGHSRFCTWDCTRDPSHECRSVGKGLPALCACIKCCASNRGALSGIYKCQEGLCECVHALWASMRMHAGTCARMPIASQQMPCGPVVLCSRQGKQV